MYKEIKDINFLSYDLKIKLTDGINETKFINIDNNAVLDYLIQQFLEIERLKNMPY